MIRHYLTFAHQAALLHRRFAGAEFGACWGQEKDRLGIALQTPEGVAGIELSIDLRIGYALPLAEIHPPKRNRVELFTELEGERIGEIDVDPAERAIRIVLSSGRQLVAPFYGPGGGNLLLVEGTEILDSFRSVDDEYATLLASGETIDSGAWDPDRLSEQPDLPLLKSLTRIHRRLGPELAREAISLVGLDPKGPVGEVRPEERDRLVTEADRLYRVASQTRTFHLYHTNEKAIFSLVELTSIPAEEYRHDRFDDLPRAIRRFRSLWFRTERFGSLRRKGIAALEKEREKLLKGIEHAGDTEAHLRRAEAWEKQGNILLANLHAIERGVQKVTLEDWEGGSVTMTLDPKLSPAENADRFFRKARGGRIEAERGKVRAEEMAKKLAELEQRLEAIEAIDDVDRFDELASLSEGLLQKKGGSGDTRAEADRYRRFTVSGGLEVFAGKNARNNDELTGRFARPNDIWLHARGTSGSHVVMRWDRREENPPARALEEAAMIAAHYSGARGSDLVAVSWTRRKYVRKPKGAPPGAVLMTREDVLLVPPTLPG